MTGETILAKRSSADGMGTIAQGGFRACFDNLAADWTELTDTAVACGMVGSRQGWIEAPYTQVPSPPLNNGFAVADGAVSVHVIGGLCQRDPDDVMRGEETQIAGFVMDNADWTGTICLPGTHTKWADIENGRVVSFRTCMSGDLFSALTTATVLKHSATGKEWDAPAFDRGFDAGFTKPDQTLAHLFAVRARGLLSGDTAAQSRSYLSGLLIGNEVANMRSMITDRDIAIIGCGTLADLYKQALTPIGKSVTCADNDTCTLRGLTAAYHAIRTDK